MSIKHDLAVRADPFAVRARRVWLRTHVPVVAVVAGGGALGAVVRYAITLAWPCPPSGFPWAVLLINITGCAFMGVVMVLMSESWAGRRLVRPFLGTGVLGGYTTFSTYAADTHHLIDSRHAATALLYLFVTPVTALLATWLAATATRRVSIWRTR